MRICTRYWRQFGQIVAAIGLLLSVFAAGPAVADENAVFAVSGIAVDQTADTAAEARETALEEGHSLAFRALLEKIVLREDLQRVPALTANQVAAFVQDFSVESERNSPVRYLAELSFRFKSRDVKRFLSGNGIGFAETESKPLLVLPLHGPAGQTLLWEHPNPWFEVWAARRARHALVPLLVPLGDLNDITTIDAVSALAGDSEKLAMLRRRYGAGDTLVTQAIVNGDPALDEVSVLVISRRHGSSQGGTIIESYRQEPGESLEALLQRSLEAVVEDVQENWKRDNLLQFGTVRHLSVIVTARQLSDWLEVKRRLDGLAAVESARITQLRRGRSEVDVAYVGDERQLAVALAQRDLELLQGPDLTWELRLKSGDSPGGTPPPQDLDGAARSPEPAAEEIIPADEDGTDAAVSEDKQLKVPE